MSPRPFVVALVFALLFLTGASPASAAPAVGDTVSTTTLFADFSGDVIGAPPDLTLPAPPPGDHLTLVETSGTVRVNASIDGLTLAAQLKQQSGEGGVSLNAWPASAPLGTERITVGWRSVAQDDNPITIVACVVYGSNGNVIASVEYGPHNQLTWNSVVGDPQNIPVNYRQNRNNAFQVAVDLIAQTVSLTMDESPVNGFQNVPFAQPASDVARIGFEELGSSPQTFAVDDIYAVALARIPDRAPVVVAPASAAVEELGHVTIPVSVSDPDGDPIESLSANLSPLPAGHTATFTTAADLTSGTLAWSPALGQAGVYPIAFSASANGATATATTTLFVASLGTAVTGQFVWTPHPGDEGEWSVIFEATDIGGTTILSVPLTVLPADAAASAPLRAGSLPRALAPESPQKGPIISVDGSTTTKAGNTMTLDATATSSSGSLASRITIERSSTASRAAAQGEITLNANFGGLPADNDATFTVDRDPVVNAPAAVTTEEGTAVSVNVGATDPDADAIASLTANLLGLPAGNNAAFTTNFNNTLGTLTWTPSSGDAGDWTVSFMATNRLVGTKATTIHVLGPAEARIFSAGNKKINLASGKPFFCVSIEPVNGSFDLTHVSFNSIVMISEGTGSVSQISAATSKDVVLGDRDGNNVEDLTVCFKKADLRLLFSSLHGTTSVPVVIEGDITGGGHFRGSLMVDVTAGGGKLAASVVPNPLNPQAVLYFSTTRAGQARVRLFDASGRLVRELLPPSYLSAGEHEVAIRAEDGSGRRLASGVYFYRIDAAEGESFGRIAVVK